MSLGWNGQDGLLAGSSVLDQSEGCSFVLIFHQWSGSLGKPFYRKKWHEILCHLVVRTKASGLQVRTEILVAHLLPLQPVTGSLSYSNFPLSYVWTGVLTAAVQISWQSLCIHWAQFPAHENATCSFYCLQQSKERPWCRFLSFSFNGPLFLWASAFLHHYKTSEWLHSTKPISLNGPKLTPLCLLPKWKTQFTMADLW